MPPIAKHSQHNYNKRYVIMGEDVDDDITIETLDGDHFNIDKFTDESSNIRASKIMNSFRVSSIILQILDISFELKNLGLFVNALIIYIRNHFMKHYKNFFLYANICLLNSIFIKDSVMDKFIESLPSIMNIQKDESDSDEYIKAKITLSHERIKSTGSFINYLLKNPFTIITNSVDHIRTFVYFSRFHIFPADSLPKRQKRDVAQYMNSDNSAVIYFMDKFQHGVTDYTDIMRDPKSQQYLHLSNLHVIFQNCLTQFCAKNTLEQILKNIFTNITKSEQLCACPILDWLSMQNIKDSEFGRALIMWLFNVGKKNVLLFIGSPDAGKSFMARLIWQLFPIHTRIIQDGIFSFSNLVNSDCGLWDEPIITPELVDTIKLILEGEKDVNIAIKNKASQKLHKSTVVNNQQS